MTEPTIACEKCGHKAESTAHLAAHLKAMHGMQTHLAIAAAKTMHQRRSDEAERVRAAAPALLAAAQDAHALLWHYELVRKENGVDWGPVEMLRQEMIDQLWKAITDAVPALRQKDA